ncbi:hypothetical protein Kisp02_41730 [Kineosporia sp. NBRC 101731]|nr:hypothetical protein Kisp02_41730 [Kineosporia sp. NBRC 101731]
MLSLRSRSTLLAAMVLLPGLTTACVSTGSSEPCVIGVNYEGMLYLEQSIVSQRPGPLVGTAVERFCESGNDSQEETAPSSFDAHQLGEVDPKYAILVIGARAAGSKASSGTVFSIPQDKVPADVWAEIQALAG